MISPTAPTPAVAPSWAHGLRPPSYWPPGAAWPPTLDVARAALAGKGEGLRSIGKYPVRWLVYAASLAATGTEAALVEAYDIFQTISRVGSAKRDASSRDDSHHGGKDQFLFGPTLRAAAYHNAALTMGQFRSKSLLREAARAATTAAEALFDLDQSALLAMAQGFIADAHGLSADVVPLRWDGPDALRPFDIPSAAPRIAALPQGGVEGRWEGIQKALHGYGLGAPDSPYRKRPTKVVPMQNYLGVG